MHWGLPVEQGPSGTFNACPLFLEQSLAIHNSSLTHPQGMLRKKSFITHPLSTASGMVINNMWHV